MHAQDLAPDSMVDMGYYLLATNPGFDGSRFGPRAGILSADGRRTSITVFGGPEFTGVASYEWNKTGPDTGTLTLTRAGASSRLDITFTVSGEGTYRELIAGSTTVATGRVFVGPLPRDPTPPLFNLSTRTMLVAGQPVTMGFVVDGEKPRRVLVRAVGPTLAQFGVATPAANPTLTVFKNSAQVAANAAWGGAPSLASVFATVGAFALPANSRDCALLLTLEPGAYTAQVRGEAGSEVLVEVYFVD
ncbi:MAG: hypothetical protein HZA93_13335 [Verrucomicrobia bacterium]|nr:hypothetical protein [Verrucomicrobiota bacterium]